MGLYALASATGSPGVTTTCVAMAALTDRPTVLVEADMTGGSAILAGRLASQHPHDRSVVWLADHVDDHTRFADHVWDQTIPLPGTDHAWLVPGISAPRQARSLAGRWDGIGRGLQTLTTTTGHDVIIDLGRLATTAAATAILPHLDALLILTDPRLPTLNATRQALAEIADEQGGALITRTAVAALQRQWSWRKEDRAGFRSRPYRAREIRRIVEPCPVLTSLPFRPVDAAVYSDCGETTRWHDHAPYARAVRSLATDLREHAQRAADTLGPRSH